MDGSRPQPPKSIADGRYTAQQKLGNGAFAQIWRGCDTVTKEPVAIKFEDYRDQELMLEDEAELLRELARPSQPQGFARCLHYGDEGPWQCLVMELLGTSLEEHLQACGRMSVQSVVLVAEQALRRVEYLHSKGLIHRDLKPENFLFGVGGRIHHLYLIDFGLSRRYCSKDGHEKQGAKRAGLTGNIRYASVNALRGVPQTRRDDLEALAYVFLVLLRGELPWSGLQRPTAEEVLAQKAAAKPRDLCKGLPPAFREYLEEVRGLDYDERPDYRSLRELFRELREEQGPAEDHHFEWLLRRPLGPLEPLEPWEEGPPQPDDGLRKQGGWRSFADPLREQFAKVAAACSCSGESRDSSDSESEEA